MSLSTKIIQKLNPNKKIIELKPGRRPGAKNKHYPKRDIVHIWRTANPNGSQRQCARETGLARNTVAKWWNT